MIALKGLSTFAVYFPVFTEVSRGWQLAVALFSAEGRDESGPVKGAPGATEASTPRDEARNSEPRVPEDQPEPEPAKEPPPAKEPCQR